MKRFLIIPFALFVTVLWCLPLSSQRLLTIEDISNPSNYPSQIRGLQWIGESNRYAWPEQNNLMVGEPARKADEVLLPFSRFNDALEAAGVSRMRRFPAIEWVSENTFRFNHGSTMVTYDVRNHSVKKVHQLPEGAENGTTSPASLATAYTVDDDLFLVNGDNHIRITHDGGNGIVNGKDVHRREFGIKNGIFWSPAGNLIAFYRNDESMVTSYPLVDISQRPATLQEIRYPMAGMTSEEVTVGVYDIRSAKTLFLKTGEPKDQYLTNITWSPDEKWIYIAVLNREQNHMKLNRYSAVTGEFDATLFEEQSSFYVEPLNGILFLPNDPSRFIWQSQRNGWNHLYLYDVSGKLLKRYTSGDWVVKEVVGFDKSGSNLFFYATEASPLETQLYRIDLRRDRMHRITTVKGTHQVIPSADGRFFIDRYSNLDGIASQIDLIDQSGKVLKTLLENEDPLREFARAETRTGTISAEDGTPLWYRMILPPGFDQTRKYPVFFYVYGGPHSQLITDSWLGRAGLFLHYMAHQGYIVFTLDNRGTVNRGFGFESVIHRKLGTIEAEDQMRGVEFLHSLPYVDKERMGINGWSYGGFMTISMMQRYPGVFKAGVAGGPVIDWKYYEVMYGERYMQTPERNPMGYRNASLLNGVDSLSGRLLIIHGDMDPVVVPQHSLDYLQKAVEKKKLVDFFIYPGHEHNIRGVDREHLNMMIARYMQDHLR